MAKYKVGNSGYKIKIKSEWKVLDVGSGHNPHPRASIILDKYVENNKERSGKPIRIRSGQKFVKSDICDIPFKDKEFDYIIASHIAEHISDPKRFCKELIRIGKGGYIETPSKLCEILLGEPFHKWYVYRKNNTLIFENIHNHAPLGLIGELFYAIFYISIERLKPTFSFKNKYLRYASSIAIDYLLRKPWRIMKKMTYTCFEWRETFDYKIIGK